MPITIVMIYSGGNPHARCFFPPFLGLAYFYTRMDTKRVIKD